jgi:hypothetical protein
VRITARITKEDEEESVDSKTTLSSVVYHPNCNLAINVSIQMNEMKRTKERT